VIYKQNLVYLYQLIYIIPIKLYYTRNRNYRESNGSFFIVRWYYWL